MTIENPSDVSQRPAIPAVRPQTAEEAVTDAMRQAILNGDLEPGRKLGQKELAEQLGVSRIPLRDALRRLEQENLVRIDGRRGAWVTTLDIDEIAEVYELLTLLESRCISHVVEKASDDDVAYLEDVARQIGPGARDAGIAWRDQRDYYKALYAISGRPQMSRLISLLRDNVGRYHILLKSMDTGHAHEEQIRCLKERDVKGAEQNVALSLESARDRLIMKLTEVGTEQISDDKDGTP